jgi:hypothetical protein
MSTDPTAATSANPCTRCRPTKTKPRARPYRVLNLDGPTLLTFGKSPIAMINEHARWCLTRSEALYLAGYAKAKGYRVEIVVAVEETP